MVYSVGQLQEILRQAGWPDETVNTNAGPMSLIVAMAAIGKAESGGNPTIRNPNLARENSIGLWQINRYAHPQYPEASLKDPIYNAQAALAIYRRQGLRAWGAYTDGRWKQSQYLAASQAAYGGGTSSPAYTDGGTFAFDVIDTEQGFSGTTLLLAAGAVVALIVILDL